MYTEEAINILNEALVKYNEAKKVEAQLKDLKEVLSGYKEKLKREMSSAGIKKIESESGWAKWVDSRTAGSLDKEAIASDLGVENLDQYKREGKPYSFVKFTPQGGEEKLNQ